MALSLKPYTTAHKKRSSTQLLEERSKKQKVRLMANLMENAHHLPESMITEILSWLQVKELLQYKSVCKSWYSIISSSNFISQHLRNYCNNSNNVDGGGCLLVQRYVSQNEIVLFELLLDGTPRVLAVEELHRMPMYRSFINGPCNGIYYLYQYSSGQRALWNPTINELKVLPEITFEPSIATFANYEVCGFGLNPGTTDEFKVVVIKDRWRTSDDNDHDDEGSFATQLPQTVMVYSSRTNSWKYCGDLAKCYYLEMNNCYIYVNGCCYWYAKAEVKEMDEVIISFDMANNAFKEMDVPGYAQPSSRCLGVYDDSIAFYSLHGREKVFELWTWDDGCCWTKKLTVGPGPFSDVSGPVGQWKNNKVILRSDRNRLLLFDPESKEVIDLVGFLRNANYEGVFTYMESLVSINQTGKP
ncbi:unnamed protein product [Cuscuta epithymum]|uniref:F-box domain-containing protein n=1 Tax=Cuscuta epithymum TaxID=186058 RepID=A0AAV0DV95_9ASTE|nr:unnamed protein product [Cuscuta epithymum]